VRLVVTFALLCLLLTGCDLRDARLREKLVGTWVLGDSDVGRSGVMVIRSYGSMYSDFTHGSGPSAKEVVFQGTWIVKDGYFLLTATNIINPDSIKVEPVGTTERAKIVKLDGTTLEILYERDQKISWQRKR
jgi:hypothetical protein